MNVKKQISPFVLSAFAVLLSAILGGIGWLIVLAIGTHNQGVINAHDIQDIKNQKIVDEQHKVNVNLNTRLFIVEIHLRDDSVKKATYRQLKEKPHIQFDELKGMKTK